MEHVHEGNMSIFEYGKSSNCDFSTHAIVLFFLFRYVQIMDIKTKIPNFVDTKGKIVVQRYLIYKQQLFYIRQILTG